MDGSGALRAGESEQLARDLAQLDLVAALGDPVSPVVPVDVLKGLVPRVADAPVDLDRPVRRVAREAVRPVVAIETLSLISMWCLWSSSQAVL